MTTSDDQKEDQEDDEDAEGYDDGNNPRRQGDLIPHPGIQRSCIHCCGCNATVVAVETLRALTEEGVFTVGALTPVQAWVSTTLIDVT